MAAGIADGFTRVRAVAALAPDLPDELLEAALGAAANIPNDNFRARALIALGPNLPNSLLAEAIRLVLLPTRDTLAALGGSPELPRTLAVLWTRCHAVGTPATRLACLGLLRAMLKDADRNICLRIISANGPIIAHVGGTTAVKQSAAALVNVHRWLP